MWWERFCCYVLTTQCNQVTRLGLIFATMILERHKRKPGPGKQLIRRVFSLQVSEGIMPPTLERPAKTIHIILHRDNSLASGFPNRLFFVTQQCRQGAFWWQQWQKLIEASADKITHQCYMYMSKMAVHSWLNWNGCFQASTCFTLLRSFPFCLAGVLECRPPSVTSAFTYIRLNAACLPRAAPQVHHKFHFPTGQRH